MKLNILTSIVLLSLPTLSLAEPIKEIIPGLNKLKLNQEVYLTDALGIVNPKTVILLQVGDLVRILRPDKTLYTGIVTETIEENDSIRIYGKVNNKENTSFGFAASKGGIFAGAIIEHNSETIYSLELSEAHKGYIFLYTTKYDKKFI